MKVNQCDRCADICAVKETVVVEITLPERTTKYELCLHCGRDVERLLVTKPAQLAKHGDR